jgi:hypothetical protein
MDRPGRAHDCEPHPTPRTCAGFDGERVGNSRPRGRRKQHHQQECWHRSGPTAGSTYAAPHAVAGVHGHRRAQPAGPAAMGARRGLGRVRCQARRRQRISHESSVMMSRLQENGLRRGEGRWGKRIRRSAAFACTPQPPFRFSRLRRLQPLATTRAVAPALAANRVGEASLAGVRAHDMCKIVT